MSDYLVILIPLLFPLHSPIPRRVLSLLGSLSIGFPNRSVSRGELWKLCFIYTMYGTLTGYFYMLYMILSWGIWVGTNGISKLPGPVLGGLGGSR